MDVPIADLEPAQLRPLEREEYEALVCRGFFTDERIELLGGLLVAREPQSAWHADVIDRLSAHFVEKLGRRARVRIEKPLAVVADSEPEPDLALVPPRDYRTAHPSAAWLVVEVAETSMTPDERIKAAVYVLGRGGRVLGGRSPQPHGPRVP
ncbi:MAG: Uma2 family endonuclease [Myxococcaceae bacterium]|nr:Uma2 family endonuclease [Myxococcaceae bacterium]